MAQARSHWIPTVSYWHYIANSSFPAANEAADETLVSSGGPPTACELSAGMHTASLAPSYHLFFLSLPGSWSMLPDHPRNTALQARVTEIPASTAPSLCGAQRGTPKNAWIKRKPSNHLFFYLTDNEIEAWASLVVQTVNSLTTMQETGVWSLGREDPLEKRMVTHSCFLAWRIPLTEEPGGLQSMGSQSLIQLSN